MKIFRFGSWAFGVGIPLTGVGAGIAALEEFKSLGIAVMAVGGVLLLGGFVLLVIGLWSYMTEEKRRQEQAETREQERDLRDVEAARVNAERLEIERQNLEIQQKRVEAEAEFRAATTAEQIASATASAETALSMEQQSLMAERATKEAWLKVAVNYEDGPRTKILEAELEINRLRMAAVERDLEALKASLPTKAERQREAVEAVNRSLRMLS